MGAGAASPARRRRQSTVANPRAWRALEERRPLRRARAVARPPTHLVQHERRSRGLELAQRDRPTPEAEALRRARRAQRRHAKEGPAARHVVRRLVHDVAADRQAFRAPRFAEGRLVGRVAERDQATA